GEGKENGGEEGAPARRREGKPPVWKPEGGALPKFKNPDRERGLREGRGGGPACASRMVGPQPASAARRIIVPSRSSAVCSTGRDGPKEKRRCWLKRPPCPLRRLPGLMSKNSPGTAIT